MISTIVDSKDEPKEKLFPKLMVDKDGWVFLITNKSGHGCVIYKPDGESLPKNIGPWDMTLLTDFHGTIQLGNE